MARKISARELVADIKSGMSYDALAEHYALSDQDAEKVYSKLVASGLVRIDELPAKSSTESIHQDSEPISRTLVSFRCPVCGTVAVEGDEVCLQCGMRLEGSGSQYDALGAPEKGTADRGPGYTVYQPTSGSSRRMFWIILSGAAVCLVLFFATGVWWVMTKAEEQRRLEAARQVRIEEQKRLAAEAKARRREAQKPSDGASGALQSREEEIARQDQLEQRVKELEGRIRFQKSGQQEHQ
ncbi:MAG: hypothetical protein HY914_02005 [Desulfomonile tiedjei]|nr:hypothetical protein [Desulfomonile tiedjei]